MLYLTCTTITSVDLAKYGVSRAKDWVSVDCGTILCKPKKLGYPNQTSLETALTVLIKHVNTCIFTVKSDL